MVDALETQRVEMTTYANLEALSVGVSATVFARYVEMSGGWLFL
jgi:hypothetical protein